MGDELTLTASPKQKNIVGAAGLIVAGFLLWAGSGACLIMTGYTFDEHQIVTRASDSFPYALWIGLVTGPFVGVAGALRLSWRPDLAGTDKRS
jgi:hypothetical protein